MSSKQLLYDTLGGAAAVTAVVDAFYERVLGDPTLAGFFKNVDMSRQKRHQVAFFTLVLKDLPANFEVLQAAHFGTGIEDAHFDSVAGHLIATLESVGVPATLIDEVISRVGPVRPYVVEPKGAGAKSSAA